MNWFTEWVNESGYIKEGRMTLDEAKDQVAREFEYLDWEDLEAFYIQTQQPETLVKRVDQAAELYARSKWDECYIKTIDNLGAKPEFKP